VRRQIYGYLPSRMVTSTKLYCSVTEAHVCEQLVQGCHAGADLGGD